MSEKDQPENAGKSGGDTPATGEPAGEKAEPQTAETSAIPAHKPADAAGNDPGANSEPVDSQESPKPVPSANFGAPQVPEDYHVTLAKETPTERDSPQTRELHHVAGQETPPAPGNHTGHQVPPHMPPPPHAPYNAPPAPPIPPQPKTMETAFAYLFLLGLFGGHKFYMGQNTLGNVYLIVGLVFVVFLGLPIIGSFFGFFVFLGLLANLYADIRTMREQLERSARGEEFTVDTQMEFFAKAFSSK